VKPHPSYHHADMRRSILRRLPALLAASLLLALTMPAVAQGCKLSKLAEWTVRDGSNYVTIDGAINDKPVGVVIDTGATRSLILRKTAVALDLPISEARGMRFFGVGGETKAEVAQVDHLRIGEAEVPALALFVAGDTIGAGNDVLLGQDFLAKFDVEFDLENRKVRLFRAQDCKDVSLAYWTRSAPGEVEIEDVTSAQPKVAFDVSLNGKRMPAILDSGAPTTVVPSVHAESVGVTPASPGVTQSRSLGGLGSKRMPSWIGTFAEFAIGNESIPDVRIRFGDLWGFSSLDTTGSRIRRNLTATEPLLLGNDFLRAHRTFIVNSHRRMYFTYEGGPVFRIE